MSSRVFEPEAGRRLAHCIEPPYRSRALDFQIPTRRIHRMRVIGEVPYRLSASLPLRLLRLGRGTGRGDGGLLVLGAGAHGFLAVLLRRDFLVDRHLLCHTSLPSRRVATTGRERGGASWVVCRFPRAARWASCGGQKDRTTITNGTSRDVNVGVGAWNDFAVRASGGLGKVVAGRKVWEVPIIVVGCRALLPCVGGGGCCCRRRAGSRAARGLAGGRDESNLFVVSFLKERG